MRLAARIALAAGLAVMIGLIVRDGGPPILTLLSHAGWVLLLLVPLHALPLALDARGWRTLIERLAPSPGIATLFWIASVREAINRLLPVANVGGEIVGIRLLAAHGVEGARAAASVVIEVLLTLVSQCLFITLGIVLVLRATGGGEPLGGVLAGLGIALALIVVLYALLRYGSVFERLERLARLMIGMSRGALRSGWLPADRSPGCDTLGRDGDGASRDSPAGDSSGRDGPSRDSPCRDSLGRDRARRGSQSRGSSPSGGWQQLDLAIRKLCEHRLRMAATVAWQLSGLVAGVLETWLALRWLGRPIDFAAAIALESLTQALRQFVFIVPAGLGVQEAGLIGFGSLLGLPSDVAITLSLVKRMREVVFGVPALASWQWAEGWRGLPRKT